MISSPPPLRNPSSSFRLKPVFAEQCVAEDIKIQDDDNEYCLFR